MKILLAGPFPIRKLPEKFEHAFFLDPLCQAILDAGHELVMLTCASGINNVIFKKKGNVSLYVVPLGKHGRLRALFSFRREILRMADIIRKEDQKKPFQVLNAHWCYEYAMACLRVKPEKTVITVHDWPDIVCPMFHNFYWRKRQKLGNQVLSIGKRFIAVSPYIKEQLKQRDDSKDISVISNSIQLEGMKDVVEESIDSDVLQILCVNNGFSERKNVKRAMIAFSEYYRNNRNSKLILCGADYGSGEAAEVWARKNNIDTTGVIFVGFQTHDQLEMYYQNADIFLHLSREESFGLVFLEAMKYHCAIIAGKDSGAVPWVLDQGTCGKLVDVERTEDVVNAISFFSTKENRHECVENGLRRIRQFDEKIVLSSYLKLLERI